MESSEEETEYCSNCKHDIPIANYVMHKTHCERRIVLCEKCEEPVPRTEMDAHNEEYHVLIPCDCGESFEKEDLEGHKEGGCRLRTVQCQYCELELTSEKMVDHVDYCGTRTEKCEKCNQFVKLREQAAHDLNSCGGSPNEVTARPNRDLPGLPFGRNPYLPFGGVESILFDFPSESLSADHAELVPGVTHYRPTVMEELDSGAMVGQRRSTKNETTERHNMKNERTVQPPRSRSVDEDDGAQPPSRQQEENDRLLALILAQQEVETHGSSLDPPLHLTSSGPVSEALPLYDDGQANGIIRQSSSCSPSPPDQTGHDGGVHIPCETCKQLIPLDTLEIHQVQCQQGEPFEDRSPLPLSDSEDEFIPFSDPLLRNVESPIGGDFPLNNLQRPPLHAPLMDSVAMPTASDRNNVGGYESPIPDAEVSLVPCEFCHDHFPFVSIAYHQASCDDAPQNRQIGDDMREYGFNNQGDETVPPVSFPVFQGDLPGPTAMPLAALAQLATPPDRPPHPGNHGYDRFEPTSSALNRAVSPEVPHYLREEPSDNYSTASEPSGMTIAKKDNRLSQSGLQSAVVRARNIEGATTMSSLTDTESQSRRMKRQPDPSFNHLETTVQRKGTGAYLVSPEKTMNMLQKSSEPKSQNEDHLRSQSHPANTNYNHNPPPPPPQGRFTSSVLQPGRKSAFQRPTHGVASQKKTSNMQKDESRRRLDDQSLFTANGLHVNGGAKKDHPPDWLKQNNTTDRPTIGLKRDVANGHQNSTAGSAQMNLQPRTSNSLALNGMTSGTGSRKKTNVDVSSRRKAPSRVDPDLTKRGGGQRSQPKLTNSSAQRPSEGARDQRIPVKNGFELSSQVIFRQSSVGKKTTGSPAGKPKIENSNHVDRRKTQNGFGSDSLSSYSWESEMSVVPVDRTSMRGEGQSTEESGKSAVRNRPKPSSNQRKIARTNSQGTNIDHMSSSNYLQDSSLQVTGSAAPQSEGGIRGDSEQREQPMPGAGAVIDDEEYARKLVAGTQEFMSSNRRQRNGKKTRGGSSHSRGNGARPKGESTGPRCSANFGGGQPHQTSERGRPRGATRGGSCQSERK